MTTLDDMLAKQRVADALERCTDKGVTERPPAPGQTYFGFAVHMRLGLALSRLPSPTLIIGPASTSSISCGRALMSRNAAGC